MNGYGQSGGASVTRFLFGDGSDGDIIYDAVDARWEDGSGNALATVAGKWTVAGAVLTYHRNLYCRNVTVPVGATLQAGTNHTLERPEIYWSGVFTCDGTFRAGFAPFQGTGASADSTFGAAKAVAGAGVAAATGNFAACRIGRGGGGGAGGGDGTNTGGNGARALIFAYPDIDAAYTTCLTVTGTVGAGGNGGVPSSLAGSLFSYDTCPRRPGYQGWGGGGGALKVAGGTNVGGAGGAGGAPGGVLVYSGNVMIVGAAGAVNADGGVGANGAKGVATNAAGDISGGGGAGGGGGGGVVCGRSRSLTVAGVAYTRATLLPSAVSAHIRASGAAGGTGGPGEVFDATPDATYNGGNGASGGNGVVALELVL
jgi:hypothetical protein